MKPLLAAAVLLVAGLAGCATPAATDTDSQGPNPRVLIHTTLGDMTAEIYQDKAPITAANFLAYVREGFYKDRQFYRIEPGFVTQGGGERQGNTGSHPPIEDEAKASGLHNLKYTLAMARTTNPKSATTEFYINAADNTAGHPNNLDPGGVSPDGYAVFGIIETGRAVADKLNAFKGTPPPTFTITLVGSSATTSAPTTTAAPPPPCPSAPDMGRSRHVAGGVELDLITPGVWNVCSDTETSFVWVHNNGTGGKDYAWSITGPNGSALPSGWSVSFAKPGGTLSAVGTKAGSGVSTTYPDWAGTRVTLKLPSNHQTGNVSAELHAAGATRAFTFMVHASRPTLSGPGSSVNVHYEGTFEDNGAAFDDGEFPTTLGRTPTETVPGFDGGLMGLALGETATLRIPPAFGYGYDRTGSMAQFNGRTLVFEVTMLSIQ